MKAALVALASPMTREFEAEDSKCTVAVGTARQGHAPAGEAGTVLDFDHGGFADSRAHMDMADGGFGVSADNARTALMPCPRVNAQPQS